MDSDVFHTWATEILLPELPACSVIVMDNTSFHKRQDTLDALQAEGHTVLWLPPYSPDFNLDREDVGMDQAVEETMAVGRCECPAVLVLYSRYSSLAILL